jgi:hypothetical protein
MPKRYTIRIDTKRLENMENDLKLIYMLMKWMKKYSRLNLLLEANQDQESKDCHFYILIKILTPRLRRAYNRTVS